MQFWNKAAIKDKRMCPKVVANSCSATAVYDVSILLDFPMKQSCRSQNK